MLPIGYSVTTRKTRRLWTSLTVAGALVPASGALAAPDLPDTVTGIAAAHDPATPSLLILAQGGEGGEGGEGDEGGEAGFDASKAATDPTVYLVGLDVMRAHYIAGLASYATGDTLAGTEMFAHARSEAYVDLEPALTTLGVPEFDDLMQKTGDLALSKAPVAEVNAAANAVFAALDAAEAKAPGKVTIEIKTAVFADLLDRAALQYAKALRDTSGDAYLDGYGFLEAAKARSAKILAHLDAGQPVAAAAAREALAALSAAYPSIKKPDDGAVKPGASLVATSKFRLALSGR